VKAVLATKAGKYAAACALDFSKPPNFYDTSAFRDSEGHEMLMRTYPYFRSRKLRNAMEVNQLVPSQSCLNGIGKRRLDSPSYEINTVWSLVDSHLTILSVAFTLLQPSFPQYSRLPRARSPRRLRVLSHPHRQAPKRVKRLLFESECPRRLRCQCLPCCSYYKALALAL